MKSVFLLCAWELGTHVTGERVDVTVGTQPKEPRIEARPHSI